MLQYTIQNYTILLHNTTKHCTVLNVHNTTTKHCTTIPLKHYTIIIIIIIIHIKHTLKCDNMVLTFYLNLCVCRITSQRTSWGESYPLIRLSTVSPTWFPTGGTTLCPGPSITCPSLLPCMERATSDLPTWGSPAFCLSHTYTHTHTHLHFAL